MVGDMLCDRETGEHKTGGVDPSKVALVIGQRVRVGRGDSGYLQG